MMEIQMSWQTKKWRRMKLQEWGLIELCQVGKTEAHGRQQSRWANASRKWSNAGPSPAGRAGPSPEWCFWTTVSGILMLSLWGEESHDDEVWKDGKFPYVFFSQYQVIKRFLVKSPKWNLLLMEVSFFTSLELRASQRRLFFKFCSRSWLRASFWCRIPPLG